MIIYRYFEEQLRSGLIQDEDGKVLNQNNTKVKKFYVSEEVRVALMDD